MSDTLLLVTATTGEMKPLLSCFPGARPFRTLVAGVGPAESSFQLCRFLEQKGAASAVLVFGVGGAYSGSGVGLLDLCVASTEVFGDLGRCRSALVIEQFHTKSFPVHNVIAMDPELRKRSETILSDAGWRSYTGVFVTVSCASASSARGAAMRDMHKGLCENMEGAAIARVCQAYAIPCLEIRVVSNMVDDAGRTAWRLEEACERAAQAAATVTRGLCFSDSSRVPAE